MSNMNDMTGQTASRAITWAVPPTSATGRTSPLASLFSVQTLKQAALRIADARHGGGLHTRDLVGLLVSHAQRNRRMVQPRATMRMTIPVNVGKVSVRLTMPR